MQRLLREKEQKERELRLLQEREEAEAAAEEEHRRQQEREKVIKEGRRIQAAKTMKNKSSKNRGKPISLSVLTLLFP